MYTLGLLERITKFWQTFAICSMFILLSPICIQTCLCTVLHTFGIYVFVHEILFFLNLVNTFMFEDLEF